MAVKLRRAVARKPSTVPLPISKRAFIEAQLNKLLEASDRAKKILTMASMPGQDPGMAPQFARGGAVHHGSKSPAIHAKDLLRGQGINNPSLVSVNHVASSINSHHDAATVALAVAQAASAEHGERSLGRHDKLHLLHHAAARRGAFADGGAPLQPNGLMHPAVAAAMAAMNQRPHFDDGGGEGEGSSRSGGSSSSGGDSNGGDGHGNSGDSSSSSSGSAGGVGGFGGSSSGDGYGGGSSSGSAGGVGGFGGGSNDGYGGGSSSSSGSAGGVGGFGGGSSDGYGGGSSSSSGSNSNASSGSSGGVGGFGGGSSGGTQTSGGFSSGAASGSDSGNDSGGVGGSVSSSGVMGGAGLSGGAGYGSSTSASDVGSMGGSVGAPAAGGFSSEGAPATGGFGNFGATPSAYGSSGMVGATPSASMMSGQTAGQSMASEASNSAGEAGEDGTNGLGSVSTSGAFNSFGPSAQQGFGSPSPYGGLDSARSAFGATSATDGTTGTTLSSVAASNPTAVAGLSPSGQMMGVMGTGGMDSGIAGAMGVGTTGTLSGPGAYGFSTMNRDGSMPGFDNFSPTGSVQQSSLGAPGYGGTDVGSTDPNGSYSTPSGIQTGALTGALQGGLPSAQGYVGTYAGLSPAVAGALAAAGQTDPSAQATPTTAPAEAYHGVDPAVIGGMFGDVGSIFSGITGREEAGPPAPSVAASPYGTLSRTPMGPALTGSLQTAMGTDRTSDTPGLNADGDPTAVNGMSALTIHGPQTEAAQGAYDAPGTPTPFGGIPDQQAFNARQNIVTRGYATPQDSATLSGYGMQQAAPAAVQTAGLHPAVAAAMAATNASPAVGSDTSAQAPAADTSSGQDTNPTAQAEPGPSAPGMPAGSFYNSLHAVEGGALNGRVDPNNPTHYGPAQFSQGTFSDTAAAHPELGIGTGMSMFNATREQYAAITQAHVADVQSALKDAGFEATPANTYLGWNLGIAGAKRALKAGPDATLAQAGISTAVQYANPSIYGYKDTAGWHPFSTMGQVQANLAAKFAGSAVPTGPAPTAAIAPGRYANYSPGAASGMDTTAPASFNGISPESTYSPGVATPGTEPTTQTVTTPAPYSVTTEVEHALTINGLAPTPANALAADTFGVANGIAIMNGPPNEPISSVDISPATVQAHPDLFSGVQTIGDLQGKIAAAAPTAGFTTQQVTTPGTPAVNGLGDLPGYSYSPGAASGLDTPDTSAQETGISQPGVYGTPSPLTIARGVLAGQQPSDAGFSPGAASGADTAMDPTTPDGAPAKHLSVPNWMGNGVAGMVAGSLLGPVGTLLGMGNTISGWVGGPTAADGINAALAHPGAPSGVTGGGDNSNAAGREGPYNQPYVPGGYVGDGTGNGNDPQATSTAPAPDGALPYSAPPLTIRRRHQYYDTTTPSVSFYNPMTDPAVARALAAMRS